MKNSLKSRKAELTTLVKLILWIIFFLLAVMGVYYLAKFFNGMI